MHLLHKVTVFYSDEQMRELEILFLQAVKLFVAQLPVTNKNILQIPGLEYCRKFMKFHF